MTLYAQVKDGIVKNVWDNTPPVPVGEDGWMNAIEIIPEITSRQELGQYTYNIGVDVVTISREVINIPFETKKQALLDINKANYQVFLDQLSKSPAAYTREIIDTNRLNAKQNELLVSNSSTYEELETVEMKHFVNF